VFKLWENLRKVNFALAAISLCVFAGVGSGPSSLCAESTQTGSDLVRPLGQRQLLLGRDFSPTIIGTINAHPKVKQPRIIGQSEWGGEETTASMKPHTPTRITIHHEGSPKPLTPDQDPKKLLQNLQKWGRRERGWPDLPYHFLVDLDGNIYAGRNPQFVGDTNTNYDPTGHLLISVMGNYEIQAPNEKQLNAISELVAWLCDYYNIPPETVRCHQEYVPTTLCPGKYLAPYVLSGFFEGEVRKRIREAYVGQTKQ